MNQRRYELNEEKLMACFHLTKQGVRQNEVNEPCLILFYGLLKVLQPGKICWRDAIVYGKQFTVNYVSGKISDCSSKRFRLNQTLRALAFILQRLKPTNILPLLKRPKTRSESAHRCQSWQKDN